ncbi:MAG: flagellar export protein FliJ [Nitrospirae bacterium]|nr:flagellar export protein FliJ [Nitrospirota bacterium]
MANIKTLERIQELREFKKDEIAQEVKKAAAVVKSEYKRLETMEVDLKENLSALDRNINSKTGNINEITLIYDYIEFMYRKIDAQKVIIIDREKELAAKELELLEAFKDVKVIETLKDKMINEEKKRQSAIEQKTMDYLYLSRMPKA